MFQEDNLVTKDGQTRGGTSAQVDQMSMFVLVYERVINSLIMEVAARTETKRWIQSTF